MKRSCDDEYIMDGLFPNELLYEIVGTDLRVMGKLAQTSKVMGEWLDKQAGLFFRLFKYNFKNEYCLLHDLIIRGEDVDTAFYINDTHFLYDDNDEDIDVLCEYSFSLCTRSADDSLDINVDFIMDSLFSSFMQCRLLDDDDPACELLGGIYRDFCIPWNALIIERCETDTLFALKMSRLFNRVLHPYGYPHASYYMCFQSDARRLLCRILKTLQRFAIDVAEDRLLMADSIQRLQTEFFRYLLPPDGQLDQPELDALRTTLMPTREEGTNAYEAYSKDGKNDINAYTTAMTNFFINKLNALTLDQLPPKRDATQIYQWWLQHAVPCIKELSIRDPTCMPSGGGGWEIEEDAEWAIETKQDCLYYDTIDETLFKDSVMAFFLKHETTATTNNIERDTLLSTYRSDFEKDNNRARLEQRYFRLFLYHRISKYPALADGR